MKPETIIIIQATILALCAAYFVLAIVMRSARRKRQTRLKDLINDAMITDGGHHKQWYLNEIAKELDIDPETEDKGVAP